VALHKARHVQLKWLYTQHEIINALFSKVCKQCALSSRHQLYKINLTSTIETSQFTVNAFEESADGSAFIFLRWFNLAYICRPIQVTDPHKQRWQATASKSVKLIIFIGHQFHVPLRIQSTEILFK